MGAQGETEERNTELLGALLFLEESLLQGMQFSPLATHENKSQILEL